MLAHIIRYHCNYAVGKYKLCVHDCMRACVCGIQSGLMCFCSLDTFPLLHHVTAMAVVQVECVCTMYVSMPIRCVVFAHVFGSVENHGLCSEVVARKEAVYTARGLLLPCDLLYKSGRI